MRVTSKPAVWLALGLALTLAACNTATQTSGTGPSLSITSSGTSSGASYHLTGTTGTGATKITYTVNDGPVQTINLTGTTFDVTVTLKPGANTITLTVYDAAGDKTTKTDTVTHPTGTLSITISGLSGHTAKVLVTGPSSFSSAVTTSTSKKLTDLDIGTYTLIPETAGDGTYVCNGPVIHVDVTGGATASATVRYMPTGGAMSLRFVGPLPKGSTSYQATLTGETIAGSITKVVAVGYNNGSTTTAHIVPYLPVGPYVVTAATLHGPCNGTTHHYNIFMPLVPLLAATLPDFLTPVVVRYIEYPSPGTC